MEVVIYAISKTGKNISKSFQNILHVYFIGTHPYTIETNDSEGYRLSMRFDEPPMHLEVKPNPRYEGYRDLYIYGDVDVADIAEFMATHSYKW